MLDSLAEVLKWEQVEATAAIENLRKYLQPDLATEIDRHKAAITDHLEFLLAANYYGITPSYAFKLRKDSVVKQAIVLSCDK